jgi:hypothetical protein
VGTGAAAAARVVTRPFRWVDIDGDGVPDEPQALTAARAAGRVVRPSRSVDLDGDGVPDEPVALTAVKGVGKAIAPPFRPKNRGRDIHGGSESHSAPGVTGADASIPRLFAT